VALIGHLQVANQWRAASATLTAASSGPNPKAPGSAGGYLLGMTHFAVIAMFAILIAYFNIRYRKSGTRMPAAESIG
jgi:hypothetical protein